MDACDILILDNEGILTLRASTAVPEMNNRFRLSRGKGISGQVLQSGEAIFVGEDVESHEHYTRFPGVMEGIYASIAVLPIKGFNYKTKGVIAVKRTSTWKFSKSEKEQLVEIAEQVGYALDVWQSAYNAGAQTNRLGALSEVSKTISSSPYLEEILQLLVNLTAQQFDYRVCTVRLLDENRQELVVRATQSPAKAYQSKRAIKLGESIAGRAIAENRPIIVPDVQVSEDYIGHDLAVQQGLRSMICVPLTIQQRPVGVLSCYTSEVRDFEQDEISALETLAKQAAVSIEHAKLQVRDTLMQEMHHRVKNNLQQVASLMRLQLRHAQYKSLEEALNDTLARILAISAVHDLLSRDDLDHVELKSIADALIQHQMSSLILPDRHIQFTSKGDEVRLNMNQATQVALVINELILNAVEHGFKICHTGEVHINIEERDESISLWVSNNGDHLPEGFDMAKAAHLGLQIVENLSRSLNGKFKLSDVLGWTVAHVEFQRSAAE